MANLWWFGMTLAVFASMAGTIGKQLIRFSQLQKEKGTKVGVLIGKVTIVIAMALMTVIGPVIDMGAYAFAPQSLIAPLGALDVVWNTLLAPCTLGEPLTPTLVCGCILIAAGAVATSLVGDHEDKDYSIDDMKKLFARWQVLLYLLVLAIWLTFHILVPMQRSAAPAEEPWKPGNMVRGLSIGLVAGSIAGNMFCVKAFVEFVQSSIANRDGSVWAHWMPYCVFAGAIFFALSNLYFLTKGMKEYEALFMGSIFEGTLIIAACLSGGIVFREFEVFTAFEAITYFAALVGIVVGISAIAKGSQRDRSAPSEEVPQVDEQTNQSLSPFKGSMDPEAIDEEGIFISQLVEARDQADSGNGPIQVDRPDGVVASQFGKRLAKE